ncbi:MAG TPA: NAD-dependent epimerase/dehydratase family protein [Thermoanaerobaculia bacterium]|nr:NAD-dependent epimerase/dehydratase family protein [Thermoanaerobaculia bacterium]
MKIVVTGAGGFIATNLLPRLLGAAHEVHGIDNFFLGRRDFLARSQDSANFHFHEFDLLDRDRVVKVFRDVRPELVWHLAANSDIQFGTTYTDFDLKGGTLVTYNVLEAMRLTECKQLIFSSSGSIYGEPAQMPTPEEYGPILPISLYAASKAACETLITAFANNYEIRSWIFRFGNIAGPFPTHGVIRDFILKLQKDPKRLQILGDGKQSKPYVHVEDCLDGMMFGHRHARDLVNLYNLAVPDATSVNEIAQWTIEEMGLDATRVKLEYTGGSRGWPGDVPQVRLDTKKMTALGWRPSMSSAEAVRRSIRETVAQMKR